MKININIECSDDPEKIKNAFEDALRASQQIIEPRIVEDKDVYVDLEGGNYLKYSQRKNKSIWERIKDFFSKS